MSAEPLYDAQPLGEHALSTSSERPQRLREQEEKVVRRTPLALIASAPARRRRAPFFLFCFTIVAAVIGTVLVLNVSVSRTQYELVSLRQEQQNLTQDNEALTEELNNKRAPQNLAAAAAKLDMVPGGQPGVVDLRAGKVTKSAEAAVPAEDGKASKLLVAPPLDPAARAAVNAKKQADAQAAAQAASDAANGTKAGASKQDAAGSAKASESAAKGSSTAKDNAASKSATTAKDSAATEGTSSGTQGATAPTAPDTSSKQNLNGGTIPAPGQN